MMCIGCVADIWESVLIMKIYENSNLIVVLINKSYLATYFCFSYLIRRICFIALMPECVLSEYFVKWIKNILDIGKQELNSWLKTCCVTTILEYIKTNVYYFKRQLNWSNRFAGHFDLTRYVIGHCPTHFLLYYLH